MRRSVARVLGKTKFIQLGAYDGTQRLFRHTQQVANSIILRAAGILADAESAEKIKPLRQNLALLNKDIVTNGLELLQERQKSHNLQQLNDAVLQMKRIVDGVACCESLVDEGEAEKALLELDAIELLMVGQRGETWMNETLPHPQLRDMREAVALEGVANDLTSLRFRIGKIFEFKIHSLLIEDLRRHVQSLSTQEVLFRWEAASLRAKGVHTRELSAFPAYMAMTDELRMALFPNISGHHCSRSILKAIQSYRELVLGEMRNIVRKSLPSSTEDTESVISVSNSGGGRSRTKEERTSILARNIRALDANDAENLFSTIYVSIAETLRRLKTQSSVLLDIASPWGTQESLL